MIGINGRGGSTRTKDGAVRATVRNVEESDQVKPAASKVVKSTERRRGKSPGSKTSRTSPRNSPRTSPARRTPSPNERKNRTRSRENRGPQHSNGSTSKAVGSPRSAFNSDKSSSSQRSKGPSPSTIELNLINFTSKALNHSGLPKSATWAGSKKFVDDDDDNHGGNKKRSNRLGRKRDEQFLHQSISEKHAKHSTKIGRRSKDAARFAPEFVESQFKLPRSGSGASSSSGRSVVPGPESGGESPDLLNPCGRRTTKKMKGTTTANHLLNGSNTSGSPSRQTLRNTNVSNNRDRSKSWDPAARRRRDRVTALERAYGSNGSKKVVVPTTSSSKRKDKSKPAWNDGTKTSSSKIKKSSSSSRSSSRGSSGRSAAVTALEATVVGAAVNPTAPSTSSTTTSGLDIGEIDETSSLDLSTSSQSTVSQDRNTNQRSYSDAVITGKAKVGTNNRTDDNTLNINDSPVSSSVTTTADSDKKVENSTTTNSTNSTKKTTATTATATTNSTEINSKETEAPLDVSTIDKYLLMLLKQRDLVTKNIHDSSELTEKLLKELDHLKERIDSDAMVDTTSMNAGQDPAQEESEQYPNQTKTATLRRRPKSGPPAFLGGTQVFGVDPATLQLADVLHTLNILEGNRERSWRDSFEDIEQEIRAQRGADSVDHTAGPAAVQKFATDKLSKLIKLKEDGADDNVVVLHRPIKSDGTTERGVETDDAHAPTNKMFQSCQTDLSHLRSTATIANRSSRSSSRSNSSNSRRAATVNSENPELDERMMFEDVGEGEVEQFDDDDDDDDDDIGDLVDDEEHYYQSRAIFVAHEKINVSSSSNSSSNSVNTGTAVQLESSNSDGFMSQAGDDQGSEYEAAELERQERLKIRSGARMRFGDEIGQADYDVIDQELSEVGANIVGSPPKVGFGVPKLALDILKSPRTGSADGRSSSNLSGRSSSNLSGNTPPPDGQTIGTLSPDPTKMMADISSPRSAFIRHSSRSSIADMLEGGSTSPSKNVQ